MSAGLVKLLLIMAGIESNPGPYICPVCLVKMRSNTPSVLCNSCNKWVHFRKLNNCSKLTSTKDYSTNYKCPKCSNDPLQLPNNPNPPPSFNPMPPPTQPNPNQDPNVYQNYDIKILQWNCNGIKKKLDELIHFIDKHNIKIVALQETLLNPSSEDPNIPNFNLVRKDRQGDKGGGLAMFIHKSIRFSEIKVNPIDRHTEHQIIKIDNLNIVNIYIPPVSSCSSGFMPDIKAIFPSSDSLIVGDFNAHDALWHSSVQDTRGQILAEEIGNTQFGVLNENLPTRLPRNGRPTSPDITLASTSLLPSAEWNVLTQLCSDHLPIVTTLSTSIKPIKSDFRKFVNFNKANWESFTKITEEKFQDLPEPTNAYSAEKLFRRIVNKAAKRTIPGGRIKDVLPEIPSETVKKMDKRDTLRASNPDSPEIPELTKEILKEVSTHRSEKWKEKVNDIKSSSKLFKLIKALNGKGNKCDNEAIRFKGKYLSSPKAISKAFNKQYTSVVEHKSSKSSRKITKDIKKNSLDDAPSFTPKDTLEAIKACKSSKAAGPDNITNLHLKHLGPTGISYLTKIYNLSMRTGLIPDIWKSSVIIPLLKPNKASSESNSYRPVSLLCPAIKILERLILPTLTENLQIPEFQHGFRKNHSTVTALNEFNHHVTGGFNQKRPPNRTVLLQIDLSKAFDMVSHDKLLKDLNQSNLPSSMKRWFCCYLKGRQSKVNFRNVLSSSRNVRTGVPQGAVTSPILFNFYLKNLPKPPDGIHVIQYADDISIYTSGTNINALTRAINSYVPNLLNFLKERELLVSPEKSTVTLFTPDTKEAKIHPQVKMYDKVVPHEPTPKLLGVIFDTMYTFTHHTKTTVNKAKKKVNLMKSLAGTNWGQTKEILTSTYKAIGRSILEYASPIWSPIITESNWTRLQTTQNQALRIITGNHLMASSEHLHRETKILPLKDHCQMVASQFNLNCHLPGHPGNRLNTKPLPPRKLKPTIRNFSNKINQHLPILDKKDLKKKIKKIHTSSVQDTIAKYPANKVLNTTPPDINKEELQLPRSTRVALSQLRSGYSKLLNSYNNRLDDSKPNICDKCQNTPHDTQHLFSCPNNPTALTPTSLWTKPKLAARFLNLETNGVT